MLLLIKSRQVKWRTTMFHSFRKNKYKQTHRLMNSYVMELNFVQAGNEYNYSQIFILSNGL
jgi:hypothetical protein